MTRTKKLVELIYERKKTTNLKNTINIIACCDKNCAIGNDNQLLYKYKEDMDWFRQNTMYCSCVMGRKTAQQIGSPLKNRECIVLSRSDAQYKLNKNFWIRSNKKLTISLLKNLGLPVWIIGGSSIYSLFKNNCNYAYITWVDDENENADAHIFDLRNDPDWKLIYSEDKIAKSDGKKLTFTIYKHIYNLDKLQIRKQILNMTVV